MPSNSTSLSRSGAPSSSALLLQILERPGLVAAIRELPAPVLGKLIERIGLEDAGELVALATTAQLERIFDDDLWRADRAAGDETFRPERFALWLRVMQEAGEDVLVQRLCELPEDLLALALHRLVLVIDMDVVEEQLSFGDEESEALRSALETSIVEEWEEFRLIARDPDVWDDVWGALLALDRDHHDRLRALLEQCCELSTEYISGQGGLFQVLTAEEMLDSDVAAARDDRRAAEGFVTPADARAFLQLARRPGRDDQRDPITRAYFRGLEAKQLPAARRPEPPPRPTKALNELAALLHDADVIAAAPSEPLAALTDGSAPKAHLVAPAFEQAMSALRQRDPDLFSTRMRELGYLVNVWIAGGVHDGRRPRPVEAMEAVLVTCEAGLRATLAVETPTAEQALETVRQTPADTLFRRGFRDATPQARPSRR
ncbi:MAG TPA: DUF6178 family protein [Polyangia bacterium]|nr:DUF6178 family protein [Polyangia bacterium]